MYISVFHISCIYRVSPNFNGTKTCFSLPEKTKITQPDNKSHAPNFYYMIMTKLIFHYTLKFRSLHYLTRISITFFSQRTRTRFWKSNAARAASPRENRTARARMLSGNGDVVCSIPANSCLSLMSFSVKKGLIRIRSTAAAAGSCRD